MHKTCKRCRETKPIGDFYEHPEMADGRLSFCKDCVRRRVGEYARSGHGKAMGRAWAKTKKGRAKSRLHGPLHRQRYPARYKAHCLLFSAVRSGLLMRQPCEMCGSTGAEGHHDDYSQPLVVRWLCLAHHRELHRNNNVTIL